MMPNTLGAAQVAVKVGEARKDLAKLRKATDGLEAYMFKSMLQSMGGKNGLFPTKMAGGEIYRDMFETNMSDILASRGTLGIGNSIYNKLIPVVLTQAQIRIKKSTIEKTI
jgi:Rod binding domain-containing protein